jgi:tRNA threonylcarbamoyladenosine modification (KEOPS) complex Cgi121 subunit
MYKIFGAIGLIKDSEIFLKKINEFSNNNNLKIQVFDADLIFGKNHIITSVNHAIRSIKNNKHTTNSIEMEIMLYASGERQLKLAIPKMGIKKNTKNIAFILISDDIKNDTINKLLNFLSINRCDNVLNIKGKNLKKFGINKKEIKTVSSDNYEKLIIEKVALVDIIK